MKKAIKPILITLVVLCVIALVVCNFVMPTETKAFIENVMVFINQPLPIVGISLITIGGITLTIFSRTSWGKKALQDLVNKFNDFKHDISVKEQEVSEKLEQAIMIKEQTTNMLACFKEEIDAFAEQLAVACETSPNAKVKAIATTIRNKKQEIDTLYAEKSSELSLSVDETISREKRLEKMEAEIMGLIEEVKKSKGLGVQNESEE